MGKDQCKECGGELMNFSCQCALVTRTEKQMTDEEVAQRIWDYVWNTPHKKEKTGEAQRKHIAEMITEARKGMFTEARVCKWEHADSLGKYHTSCQMYGAKTFADLWNYCPHCGGKIELTERKGR